MLASALVCARCSTRRFAMNSRPWPQPAYCRVGVGYFASEAKKPDSQSEHTGDAGSGAAGTTADVDAVSGAAGTTADVETPGAPIDSSSSTGSENGQPVDAERPDDKTPYPRTLFRARPLDKEREQAEWALSSAAGQTGIGFGASLLGVAGFTPPTPYGLALLLAAFQVRLVHTWQLRQLRAQLRRHVTEVEQTAADVIKIKSDGGVIRTLRLGPVQGKRPQVKHLFNKIGVFVQLDHKIGGSDIREELDAVLESELAIAEEDVSVKPYQDETQDEVTQLTQRLSDITVEKLAQLPEDDGSSVVDSMAQIARSAQVVSMVVLAGGVGICLGGRNKASELPPGSLKITD